MFKAFASYQRVLIRRPYTTNLISSSIIFASGDFLAQYLFPESPNFKLSANSYDYGRTLRAVIYGGVIFSPIGHNWYKLIARVPSPLQVANKKLQTALNSLTRVAVDQILFSPIAVAMYYTAMSILEFRSYDELCQKLDRNYWNTLITNWKIWPAFQAFNFTFVPLEFRLLTSNVLAIFWNCFLSYHNSKK